MLEAKDTTKNEMDAVQREIKSYIVLNSIPIFWRKNKHRHFFHKKLNRFDACHLGWLFSLFPDCQDFVEQFNIKEKKTYSNCWGSGLGLGLGSLWWKLKTSEVLKCMSRAHKCWYKHEVKMQSLRRCTKSSSTLETTLVFSTWERVDVDVKKYNAPVAVFPYVE